MEIISADKKTLKKFGITMGFTFIIIAMIILFRHKHNTMPAFVFSLVLFIAAYVLPGILKPLYFCWMKLAFVLSWVNTRLLLIAVFYLLVTPLAVIARMFGTDLLDKRIDKTKQSYWLAKEKSRQGLSDYQRQF
jgi:multisubunit Na+/H+ antiporter MnhG subunit